MVSWFVLSWLLWTQRRRKKIPTTTNKNNNPFLFRFHKIRSLSHGRKNLKAFFTARFYSIYRLNNRVYYKFHKNTQKKKKKKTRKKKCFYVNVGKNYAEKYLLTRTLTMLQFHYYCTFSFFDELLNNQPPLIRIVSRICVCMRVCERVRACVCACAYACNSQQWQQAA